MDFKRFTLPFAATVGIVIGAFGMSFAHNPGVPQPKAVVAENTIMVNQKAAAIPGVTCPSGFTVVRDKAGHEWQIRGDGHSYLPCDYKESWSLTIVDTGDRVLTQYRGGVAQFTKPAEIDEKLRELR